MELEGAELLTGGDPPYDVVSMVSAFELQSMRSSPPAGSGTPGIMMVGVASDLAAHGGDPSQAQVFFGVMLDEPWSSPNEVAVEILVDRDGDEEPELALVNGLTAGLPINDSFKSVLKNPVLATTEIQGYLNALSPAERDSCLFGTNVMVLPVAAASLGLMPGDTGFSYAARASHRSEQMTDAAKGRSFTADGQQTEWLSFDLASPGLDTCGGLPGAPMHDDLDGAAIPVDFNLEAFADNSSLGLLLLHHHNGDGDHAEVITLAGEWPDLALEAHVAPDPVLASAPLRYDLVVTNIGPQPAAAVTISLELPTDVELDIAGSDVNCAGAAAEVTCDLGALAAGESRSTRVAATVSEGVSSGTMLVARGFASTSSRDPNPINDTAEASTTVVVTGTADLSVLKQCDHVNVVPGESLQYTIAVTNGGPGDAAGSLVEDVFPEALDGVAWTCAATPGSACSSESGSGDIQQTVDLISGGQITFVATAVVSPTYVGDLHNTAMVDPLSPVEDPNDANNLSTAAVVVELGLIFADGFESGDATQWQ